MWQPDRPQPEITIGDVGFIHRETGQFQRLFNATRPADDPLNEAPSVPPDNYSLLHYNSVLETYAPSYISAGTICSRSTKSARSGSQAQAGNEPGAAAKQIDLKFTCETQGAFLFLDETSDRRVVYKNQVWVRYIKENYHAWVDLLKRVGLPDSDYTLVVVRGWIKAPAWAMCVWPNKGAAQYEITLSGNGSLADGGVVFGATEGSGSSPVHHIGPLGGQSTSQNCSSPRPRDQCIFMSYFKVVDRVFWTSVKAQAGYHNLPPDDGGGEGNGPTHTEVDETRDPLDDVVDYIFLNNEDAKYAIVSDADLYELCNGSTIPANFPAYLRSQAPRCDLIDDEVAYLSIFEIIYKSHENRGPVLQPMAMQGVQGPLGIPQGPPNQQGGAPGEASSRSVDEMRSGSITLPRESHTPIKWPHAVLLDPTAEGGAPCPAALSKNGAYVGIGFEDCCVRVWNVETEELEHNLRGHDDTVLCTTFSPDNKTLVSGSADCTLLMWDMESGRIKRRLEGHDGDVWSAAFSPDGKILATGSVDTMVRFWSVSTGETFAIGEGHSAVVQCLLFVPDGTLVVSCADMECRTWDPRNGTGLSVMMGHTGAISALCCSHSGSKVGTGSEDYTTRIWSTDTGDELVTIRGHTGPVCSVQFSPDDRKVISGSYDAAITIHDTSTGDLYFTLRADDCAVHSVAWSLIGNLIVGGYADGSLKLWDAINGTKIAELRGHTDKVKSVMFSPDEDSVITSSDDGTVRVWSTVDVMRVS
ncbi:hypothetical protein NLI96_g7428 [Meripilus lineatus]|uniref:WD40 repeat-like protein n=1 Tax=Meripilus lineatus TaxID=2056292 RepID=A0AAD5V1E9_9APHY|nr:hypothetical protein NLI96_g7428 [Physisporinus lineatus]